MRDEFKAICGNPLVYFWQDLKQKRMKIDLNSSLIPHPPKNPSSVKESLKTSGSDSFPKV